MKALLEAEAHRLCNAQRYERSEAHPPRVEHVFADQENGMGGKLVRTIGIVRARVTG